MPWQEVLVAAGQDEAEAVASLLGPLVHGSPVIEETESGTWVRAYLLQDTALRGRLARLRRSLSTSFPHLRAESRRLPPGWEDAWKAFFAPIPIGERLLLLPPWLAHPGDGRVSVIIDPGPAFGTGQHPTTRLCLEALERWLRPGMRVLDLGTGSGVLAIAAARLGAGWVLALDTDPAAVKAARENTARNGVAATVSLREGSLEAATVLAPFDLLLANISSQVLIGLAAALARRARPGGLLIASGFLEESLPTVPSALEGAGWRQEEVLAEGEWRAVVARRGG